MASQLAESVASSSQFQLPHPDFPEEAHAAQPYSLQLTHPYLVSGSADKTVRIWDVQSRRLARQPFQGHQGSVICLQFDLEVTVVVSGSSDASIIVWRFSTGEIVKRIPDAHADTILSLFLDSRYLFTGGRDGKVKVWSRENEQYDLLVSLEKYPSPINALKFHSSSKTIVTGSGGGMMSAWSLHIDNGTVSAQLLQEVNTSGTGIVCLDLDPSGRFAVIGHSDTHGTITIYDLHEKRETGKIQDFHRGVVRSVKVLAASPEGPHKIVSGGYDGSVRLFICTEGRWVEKRVLDYGIAKQSESELDRAYTVSAPEAERVFAVAVDEARKTVYCSGQRNEIVGWKIGGHD